MPSRRASVYVHFPWCLAKCPYCDFVSYPVPRSAQPSDDAGPEAKRAPAALVDHRGYADAVLRELEARAACVADDVTLGSVFFGGGTPSLWEPSELGRVLDAVRARFACEENLEVTVECNPTSLDEERAARLVEVGVGRLSIGVQSLRPDELRFLGRLHDVDGALDAIRAAQRAGVPRISADLIFGLPGQSPDEARAQALALADLGLRHLSCYQLTVEAGTRFGELAKRGRLPLADDGLVAEAFEAIDEALVGRGFVHYEISNYAKPGEQARHNLAYWKGNEYVGLGCGAYGFVREPERASRGSARGVRYRNAIDPRAYVEATATILPGLPHEGDGVTTSCEALDGETLLRERIMLGLRLAEGLQLEEAAEELGVEAWTDARKRAAEWLVRRGRLAVDNGWLRIPPRAWIWADDTAARLF